MRRRVRARAGVAVLGGALGPERPLEVVAVGVERVDDVLARDAEEERVDVVDREVVVRVLVGGERLDEEVRFALEGGRGLRVDRLGRTTLMPRSPMPSIWGWN